MKDPPVYDHDDALLPPPTPNDIYLNPDGRYWIYREGNKPFDGGSFWRRMKLDPRDGTLRTTGRARRNDPRQRHAKLIGAKHDHAEADNFVPIEYINEVQTRDAQWQARVDAARDKALEEAARHLESNPVGRNSGDWHEGVRFAIKIIRELKDKR